MTVKDYFKTKKGTGIMSSADSSGKVNSAIYSRPHVFDDGTVAFLMRERLTHHNLESNPYAAFLFIEKGIGYNGVRLHLRKIREDNESPLVEKMTMGSPSPEVDRARGPKHLVIFSIEKILPLVGSGELPIET